ncbi:MAG: hypothetical protein PF638_01410 [Candidatus Delongbacteria bacterium]|jgi:mannose/fructose-specific phosphotransferase system component IIA|nr:hypothetical protein [Candidatus Delongbacteria bacterium]
MNKMLIISHGDLGQELLNTAKKIIGDFSPEFISAISNKDLSLADIIGVITDITTKDPDCFYILATDFPGGSCFIASKKVSSSSDRIITISGLNISMILSFLTKRNNYSGKELAEIIKTDGNRAIIS